MYASVRGVSDLHLLTDPRTRSAVAAERYAQLEAATARRRERRSRHRRRGAA